MFPPFFITFAIEIVAGFVAILAVRKSVTWWNGDGLPPFPFFSGFLAVTWVLAIGGRLAFLLLAAPA